MGGTSTEVLVTLRNEWEIQFVVVFSFTMQVFLFFFAGIRRFNVSSTVKILLWLVYLLADVTATYALGHLSSSTSSKHQLVGFWAPFLLLHLGGQDTITAYALEDNELWLRHLLNLFVQTTSAAYVLYKYISAGGSFVPAAILVFAAGAFKYGERIWALKCASMKSVKPRGWLEEAREPCVPLEGLLAGGGGHFAMYENVVLGAHSMLKIFKHVVLNKKARDLHWCSEYYDALWVAQGGSREQQEEAMAHPSRAEIICKIIRLELCLVYDLVYTKAAVVHTRVGNCIHAFSLVLFTTSSKRRDGAGPNYTTPDVATTYVLLIGASVVEIASAVKAIGSTWTCATLREHKWVRLARAILFVRHHLLIVKEGRWSESVGQYNLISFCSRDTTRLMARMVKWVGMEQRWNNAHYSRHAKLSPAIMELVFRTIEDKRWRSSERTFEDGEPYIEDGATWGGESWHPKFKGFDGSRQLDWSLSHDFEQSVLVWHMATDVFLHHFSGDQKAAEEDHQLLVGAIKTLSEYMMYLMAVHPDILSIIPGDSLYAGTCTSFAEQWRSFSISNAGRGPRDMVLEYTKHMEGTVAYGGEATIVKAYRLVQIMIDMKLDLAKRLQLIAVVWVDMLCFTANNAPGDFHVRQLSNGGEFLTQIILIMGHVGMPYVLQMKCAVNLTAEELSHKVHKPADHVAIEVDVNNGDDGGSEGKVDVDNSGDVGSEGEVDVVSGDDEYEEPDTDSEIVVVVGDGGNSEREEDVDSSESEELGSGSEWEVDVVNSDEGGSEIVVVVGDGGNSESDVDADSSELSERLGSGSVWEVDVVYSDEGGSEGEVEVDNTEDWDFEGAFHALPFSHEENDNAEA